MSDSETFREKFEKIIRDRMVSMSEEDVRMDKACFELFEARLGVGEKKFGDKWKKRNNLEETVEELIDAVAYLLFDLELVEITSPYPTQKGMIVDLLKMIKDIKTIQLTRTL